MRKRFIPLLCLLALPAAAQEQAKPPKSREMEKDKAAKAVTFPKSKKKRFGFSYPLTLQ